MIETMSPTSLEVQKKITNSCVVPECTSRQSRSNNKVGLCFRHAEWLYFLLWALPRITLEKQAESGLWTPEKKG